ncbi:hypothetical protein VTJ83DRAFT_793 [Remersonia thermophila]|uniref:Presequence translocated-associated motor subunit PAM17 n=1 Tax=Remersonia thermophila TaxID=72144 RepID=A0ABR4DMF8_9PEZI
MIVTAASTMLRAGAGRSAGAIQPALLRTAACPYSAGLTLSPFSASTTTTTTTNPSKPSHPSSRRSLSTKTTPSSTLLITYRAAAAAQPRQPYQLTRRHTSTQQQQHHHPSPAAADSSPDAARDAQAADAAAKAARAAHPEQVALDWNTFFALRKARRRWQSAFSVVGALSTGTAGALVLSTGSFDSVVAKVPLDPLFTLGLATLASAALGWLAGPSLGTVVFNLLKGKYKGPMAVKESEFFARIKKHRVDPSASSVRNPVPDFYGEKISSVAGYRQWLKDQRAFNRKKEGSLLL